MQKLGYGNQPYIVLKHSDIKREHLHIISLRIDENGKKINDSCQCTYFYCFMINVKINATTKVYTKFLKIMQMESGDGIFRCLSVFFRWGAKKTKNIRLP